MGRWRMGLGRGVALWWVGPLVAAGGMWMRSCRTMDEVSAVDGDHVLRAAVSYRGALHFIRAENNSTPRAPTWDTCELPAAATWGDLYDLDDTHWRWMGFARFAVPRAARAPPPGGVAATVAPARRRQVAPWLFTRPYKAFSVPYWALLAVTAAPAARAVGRSLRRALRARRGLCPRCGYDLRATAERCPECGEPVPRRRRRVVAAS